MTTIYPYPLELTGKQTIKLPKWAEILTIEYDAFNDKTFFWAEIDTDCELVDYEIFTFVTGQEIPEPHKLKYLKTITAYGIVWHFYVKKSNYTTRVLQG